MSQPNPDEPLRMGPDDFKVFKQWAVMFSWDQDLPSAYRQPKYHLEPNDQSGLLAAFQHEIYRKNTVTGQMRSEFLMARLISEGLDHVEYLERMADARHPVITEKIDVEGRNLVDMAQVRMLWHLEETMELIYGDNLILLRSPRDRMNEANWMDFFEPRRWNHLLNHMYSVDALELEEDRRFQRGFAMKRPGFFWIKEFRQSLHDAYASMVAAWLWSQGGDGVNRKLADAVECAIQDMPEMTRMLVILLEREKTFDELLTQEHVFGLLNDKRIKLINTDDLQTLYNEAGMVAPQTADEPTVQLHRYFGLYALLNGLYRQLAYYQLRLKELFDYKYIMEWHRNKMWDRLLVIIPESMNISQATVDKFMTWTQQQGVVLQNIFGAYPMRHDTVHEEICPVCLDHYSENHHPNGVVVMKTKCGHHFHPKCLFTSWDLPCYWTNRCPYCRQSGGRLDDALDFDGYQHDKDFEADQGDPRALDEAYREQVQDAVDEHRHIPQDWDLTVVDSWFRPMIERDVLEPLRQGREAARPSWGSLIGGE